jgi:hypothetical protein
MFLEFNNVTYMLSKEKYKKLQQLLEHRSFIHGFIVIHREPSYDPCAKIKPLVHANTVFKNDYTPHSS